MTDLAWWQSAVFYQIYPRSFADGNGDGFGDFPGMIDRLDYLQDLGIDAVWLSPHYPSPDVDCGYDVADYTAVDPRHGTMDDCLRFIEEAHRRKIRVLFDFVMNHTSDQHPWFRSSRSSPTDPKRDWYVWHPGKNGGPPNNWYSTFGGPAWTFDETTREYYYHFFFAAQPDLNWHNPEVRAAMWDSVRFWLDHGIDGYRVDAIGTVFEEPGLPDHDSPLAQRELLEMWIEARRSGREVNEILSREWKRMFRHQHDRPGIHDLMKELRSVVDEYPHAVLVAETDDIDYHGEGDEFHLVFNFPLMNVGDLTADHVRRNQSQRLADLGDAWPCNTLNNHDAGRVRTRFGDGSNDEAIARVAAALLTTLKGTPFLYNGEEIGMEDLLVDDAGLFRDNLSTWVYRSSLDLGLDETEATRLAAFRGRDKCRTPLQWGPGPNAGFSPKGATTWLPVHPNHREGVNVADQVDDPASMLSWYRRLLAARRSSSDLVAGNYVSLGTDPDVVRFRRGSTLVALNLSPRTQPIPLEQPRIVRLGSHRTEGIAIDTEVRLAPFEVLVAV